MAPSSVGAELASNRLTKLSIIVLSLMMGKSIFI